MSSPSSSPIGSPSERPPRRRFLRKIAGLPRIWWSHKIAMAISAVLTASAFYVYRRTFIEPNPPTILEPIQRLELNALDTRFRFRGRSHASPDPRIVIVDIDQHSQEVLGHWPFSRTNFATMLDVLRDGGAKVVAFDITFSKPDNVLAPIRDTQEEFAKLKRSGAALDARYSAALKRLESKYNPDQQFADAIEKFSSVVLGNFFLYTQADLAGIDAATLDHYASLLSYFPFPQVRYLRAEQSRRDFDQLVGMYQQAGLLPQGAEANLEIFNQTLKGDFGATGFFTIPPSTDGVVRHSFLALPYGRSRNLEEWDLYASLDLQAVRIFLGIPIQDAYLMIGPRGVARAELGPNLTLECDPVSRMIVNYRGPLRTFPYVSIADVIQRNFPVGSFRDKIVLVGASATGIADIKTTPFGDLVTPGVEIHANIIDNMLHQDFLRRGPQQILWDQRFIFLFGIALGLWLASTRAQNLWFGLLVAPPFVIGVYQAFLKGWWLNLTLPLITLVANVSLVALYRVVVEEREKRKVRGSFQQYLSPEVIRRLLEQPDLVKPRKTEVSLMFSDIRNFTTISERIDAQDLALLLNRYLSDMTRLVFNTQGTLDKYIGDAVMAFWGAPFEETDHAIRACRAALLMMQRVAELREEWTAAGHPNLDIGIGLNTGTASVGAMGSQLRFAYTAMGDSVNLASRLEGLNKEFRTHILVGPATYAAAKDAGFLFRELDLIRVQGKFKPVTIYELVSFKEDTQLHAERLEEFVRARASYLHRNWLEAQQIFQAILERWPDDGPARTYWKR